MLMLLISGQVVSRPRELPPQPLAEPCVSLSTHTAPITEPCYTNYANAQTALAPGVPPSRASSDCGACIHAACGTSGVPIPQASGQSAGRLSTPPWDRSSRSTATSPPE